MAHGVEGHACAGRDCEQEAQSERQGQHHRVHDHHVPRGWACQDAVHRRAHRGGDQLNAAPGLQVR